LQPPQGGNGQNLNGQILDYHLIGRQFSDRRIGHLQDAGNTIGFYEHYELWISPIRFWHG
jgi:hypothetical protein